MEEGGSLPLAPAVAAATPPAGLSPPHRAGVFRLTAARRTRAHGFRYPLSEARAMERRRRSVRGRALHAAR